MEVKLYVGNLAESTTEAALRQLFSQSGEVTAVSLIKDPGSGQSKGFAFVTMATAAGAQKAIEKLRDFTLAGRRLKVNMAEKPKANPRPPAKPGDGYQSKLGAFSVTDRSPKASPRASGKSGDGFQSKLGAFGNSTNGPTQPRRRGGNQRH